MSTDNGPAAITGLTGVGRTVPREDGGNEEDQDETSESSGTED